MTGRLNPQTSDLTFIPVFFAILFNVCHRVKLFQVIKKTKKSFWGDVYDRALFNPFSTRNPFWGTKLLRFSVGRGSEALKGLSGHEPQEKHPGAPFDHVARASTVFFIVLRDDKCYC